MIKLYKYTNIYIRVTKINVFKNVKVAREGHPKYGASWTIFYFNYPD